MIDRSGDTDVLVARLKSGDPEALGPLFTRNTDRLRKMVEFRLDSRLRGRISPSDVLQEAYIDALKRLPHFQAHPDVPFFIWLRTVTIQRLIEFHRQHVGAKARAADREVQLNPGGGELASTEKMAVFFVSMTSPSEAVQRAEMISRVREALDRMVPMDREVLALRHFEELSNREVAALLGIQAAAASKRHVRALERLREVVEELTPDGERGA